jgi:glycerol-3-phosphate acyltransferase PlsY
VSPRRHPLLFALVALPAAFAVGCIPTARVVIWLFGYRAKPAVGGKTGADSVRRTVGTGPAVATAIIDSLKGYSVARIARHYGAGRNLTGALAVAPLVAHVTVVRGRGAAAAVGTGFAIDEPTMLVASLPIVAGSIAKHHAFSVMLGAITYVPVRWVFTRAWGAPFWGLVALCVLVYARLRGDARFVPRGLTRETAWNRFWYDNERPRRAPYHESEDGAPAPPAEAEVDQAAAAGDTPAGSTPATQA